ncbi:MAG TPA: stage II sporulation protein D [Tissierellaceae bacterium]|nr:stage II sporulation protein D [Tissierellaceae bacterium]
MKRIGGYLLTVLVIIVFIPTVMVKTFNFTSDDNLVEGKGFEERVIPEKPTKSKKKSKNQKKNKNKNQDYIKVVNEDNGEVEEVSLDEYVKGVVAAEMPAEFHLEALKAQAIASRTYAINNNIDYEDGHPDHKEAPICSGVHCQAYLSSDELKEIHGKDWIDKYWDKIEESVESTEGLLLYYQGELIEPLYHSTSGGMTEDASHVFAMDSPYLKSVESPDEEEAPKYKSSISLTSEEFIKKMNKKFPKAKMTKKDFLSKIKLVEKSPSGRIKKLGINGDIIEGREIRDLFELNSTNFKISFDENLDLIEIETTGYGHGVGMSQWGANGMAKNGKDYKEILKHYYSGIDIKKK